MMDEGTFGMKLISSFGEWYINDNMIFIVILYLFMSFHVFHCFWHTLIYVVISSLCYLQVAQ